MFSFQSFIELASNWANPYIESHSGSLPLAPDPLKAPTIRVEIHPAHQPKPNPTHKFRIWVQFYIPNQINLQAGFSLKLFFLFNSKLTQTQPTNPNARWPANPIQTRLVNHLDWANGSFANRSYTYYPQCSTQPIRAQNLEEARKKELTRSGSWTLTCRNQMVENSTPNWYRTRWNAFNTPSSPLLFFVTPLSISCATDTAITCAYLCLLLCSRRRCFLSALLEFSGEFLGGFSQNMWFHFKVGCFLLLEGVDISFLGWCCLILLGALFLSFVGCYKFGFEFI